MASSSLRAAHEPDSEELLPLLPEVRAGGVAIGGLREFFIARDRRLKLELESSHLLGSFVRHLVAAFPEARFMLLVRECRAWIDSMINDQLNLRAWDGYARWQVVYDQYMNGGLKAFAPEEQVLRDLDLYPLSNYVRFWHEEAARIIAAVPSDRLLVLRTEELSSSVERIADFLEVSPQVLELDKSHSYRAPRKHHVLDALDPVYVESVIEASRNGS